MSQPGLKMGVPQAIADGAKPRPRFSAAWGCSAVMVVALLVAGFLGWHVISAWKDGVSGPLQKLAEVARPKIIINEIALSTVEDVSHESKFVVLKTTVNADITRQETSSSWGVYWGTNIARVLVTDAKAQYYVDLSGLGTSDFAYDESAKKVTVSIPRPVLDKDMISIDPSKIQTLDLRGGWAMWNKQETYDRAVAELIPKVIIEASKPLVKKEAEEAGRERVLSLMHPLADTLAKDGVELEIKYRE